MAENTTIDWATHSWSPWLGCSPVHTGCKNCYAQVYFNRFVPAGTRRKTSDAYWRLPLKWNRAAIIAEEAYENYMSAGGPGQFDGGEPDRPRVFPSLCDPFEPWDGPIVNAQNQRLALCRYGGYASLKQIGMQRLTQHHGRWATMADLRRDMFGLMGQTLNLDYVLATKRPENILSMWPLDIHKGSNIDEPFPVHIPNAWLLYSASDQETLNAGMPHLLKCRELVPVLGLSLEPLVGPVDLSEWMGCCSGRHAHTGSSKPHSHRKSQEASASDGEFHHHHDNKCRPRVDWVVCGGESGPNARPCALEWIDDIRRQCEAAGVRLFIKQWGSNPIEDDLKGTIGVRLKHPKGGDTAEWPERLRVQQYPEVTI